MTDKTDNLPDTRPKGIPIEDLIAYRKKGLSTTEIGKLTGCDHSNVARRLKEADLDGLDRFRENKDAAFEHLQRTAVNSITGDDLKGMNALQRITAAAILQDKIAALRGQASQIVDHRHLVVDLGAAIQRLRDEQAIEIPAIEQDAQVIDVTPCPCVHD